MAKVFGYGRESTAKQLIGMEVQREGIERYCGLHPTLKDLELVRIATDRATSGKVRFADRKEAGRLLGELREGDHLVIFKMDRGFRNIRDLAHMIEVFRDRKVVFHLVEFGADSGTDVGRLILHILASVAEFERARIAERTAEAKAYQRAHDLPVNSHAGWGYVWKKGPGGRPRRVEHAGELQAMAFIYEQHTKGWTFAEMARHFQRNKILNKWGKPWKEDRVREAYRAEKTRRESLNGSPAGSA